MSEEQSASVERTVCVTVALLTETICCSGHCCWQPPPPSWLIHPHPLLRSSSSAHSSHTTYITTRKVHAHTVEGFKLTEPHCVLFRLLPWSLGAFFNCSSMHFLWRRRLLRLLGARSKWSAPHQKEAKGWWGREGGAQRRSVRLGGIEAIYKMSAWRESLFWNYTAILWK